MQCVRLNEGASAPVIGSRGSLETRGVSNIRWELSSHPIGFESRNANCEKTPTDCQTVGKAFVPLKVR